MSKGEFNNLKGSGKPLPSYQNRNPYVDFVTHKINEVGVEFFFIWYIVIIAFLFIASCVGFNRQWFST